jgi:hypothetical protein
MIIYDETTITSAPWPDTEEGHHARRFLTPLVREGTAGFVSDRTILRVVGLDDLLIPIAIQEGEDDNSTNLSTFARYIRLPRAGLPQMSWHPAVITALGAVLDVFGGLLRAACIDKCVYVGSWILLRNMEPALTRNQARRLTAFLVERFPGHAMVFPALNPMTHQTLLDNLVGIDYALLFAGHTRMLMPFNTPVTRQERENRRRDGKLLQSSGYELLGAEEVEGCAPRLAELYRGLNREKYATNPMVEAKFFARAIRDKTLTIRVARKRGRIDGFYGYAIRGDVLFSPVFGYEMSVPQEVGLYRMLVHRLVQDAMDLGLAVETGGGADRFKSLRGDSPVPRYGAFYSSHLSVHRRTAWAALRAYANGPFLASIRAYLRQSDGGEVTGFEAVPHVFGPLTNTPQRAVAALHDELSTLRRAIDDAATLQGEALTRRTAMVSERLTNWPQPTRLVEPLKSSLALIERRSRQLRKVQGEKEEASSQETARALLQRAERRGDVVVLVHALDGANATRLRNVALAVLREVPLVVVLLAAAHEGSAVLVAAISQPLISRGLEADALVRAVSPLTGGKGGGGHEMAFGGGPRPDSIPDVLAAASRHLEDRSAAWREVNELRTDDDRPS